MLNEIIEAYKSEISNYLQTLTEEKLGDLTSSKPPKSDMGDIAFAMFSYAKVLRKAPNMIANEVADYLSDKNLGGEAKAFGPYVNIFVDINRVAKHLIENVNKNYGNSNILDGRKIMIEFSCPNTNKPLHLGHLRNDCLGESVSRILKANGAEVKKVNLINNRGVHICKSMLAYQKFGNGATPDSTGIKGDHLVGDYYVKFAQWEKEDDTAITQAQDMLVKWEEGDKEVLDLWNMLNTWTLEGLAETYKNTNVSFDKYYYESNTYKSGKDRVLDGFKKGLFYKEEDGSIWVDLSEIKLDKKVLLRKDGTSLYVTQDIGTAIERHEDYPFDSLIYVVASEQQYHFKVLFYILEKLGYSWAKNLYHLSYGMVNLPDGKMKSREGTVVDADDLVAKLAAMAKNEIIEKERETIVDDVDKTGLDIALGAIYYYLLQVQPTKDMIFKEKESLSFNGNTGPYLQYMGARMSSLQRKFEAGDYKDAIVETELLNTEEEKQLLILIDSYPTIVENSSKDFNPATVCAYLYELSRGFSSWYQKTSILREEDKNLVATRMKLVDMTLNVLKHAFNLVGIPYLPKM